MMSNTISYKSLLLQHGISGLLFAASINRLSSGILPFSLMAFFVQDNNYLSAATVSAAFMFISSVTAPWRGRYIDRHGIKKSLPLFCILSTLLILMAFYLLYQGKMLLIGASFAIIGAAIMPPNSVVLRSIWSKAINNEDERKALHTLDSLLEESTYIITPLIVTLIWIFLKPEWAILLACCAITISTILLFHSIRYAGGEFYKILSEENNTKHHKYEDKWLKRSSLLFTIPSITLILPIFGFAIATGINNIGYAAWASTYHNSTLIGIFTALNSMGALLGGLIYGKLKLTDRTTQKLYFIMPAITGLCTLPMLVIHSTIIAALTSFCAGAVMTPIFIAAFMRVPRTFAKQHYNEANASIGATYNIGVGCGNLLAGLLAEQNMLYIIFSAAFFTSLLCSLSAFYLHRQIPD